MPLLKRLSVRLTLLGIGIVAIAFIVFSVAVFTSENNRIRKDILDGGNLFAQFAATSIATDYLNYYSNPVEGMFDSFKVRTTELLAKNPDITHVTFTGTNGRVLFDSSELEGGKFKGKDRYLDDPEILKRIKAKEISHYDVSASETLIFMPIIESSGLHPTTVVYSLSYDSINKRMQEVVINIILALLPTLAISAVIIFLFSITITRPITELNTLVTQISQGNLDRQIKIQSDDEIGALAGAFNKMAVTLKESRDKLLSYNKDLEDQVAERTAALKKQNDELVDMNKVMVGRELKMVELKTRLEMLERKENQNTPQEAPALSAESQINDSPI